MCVCERERDIKKSVHEDITNVFNNLRTQVFIIQTDLIKHITQPFLRASLRVFVRPIRAFL